MILRFTLLFVAVWLPLLALWVGAGWWVAYGPKARKQRARPRLVRQ